LRRSVLAEAGIAVVLLAVHASIARITLAESTGTSVTYQHVLLVDPYSTGSGCAFRPVGGAGNQCGADVLSGHVDGVTWYGNNSSSPPGTSSRSTTWGTCGR
ncbi:hypothetical protein ABZU45_32220, partial [Streptomyces avermitilis]